MKVVPIKEKAPDGRLLSLTIGREYEVLGVEADSYRILNDPETWPYGNDPVLFEPGCFRITDATEPVVWTCEYGADGERYCYPPEWSQAGFFEDFHDGVEEVRKQFWRDLQRYFPETWKERQIQD